MSTAVAEPKRPRKAKIEYTTLKSPVPIANKLRQLVALLADDPDDAVEQATGVFQAISRGSFAFSQGFSRFGGGKRQQATGRLAWQ